MDQEDARGAGLDLAEDVGRQDDGVVAPELPHEGTRLADLVRVQSGGGLVQDDDGGPGDDGIGKPHPLAIPLRQVSDPLVRDVDHARLAHGVVDVRPPPRAVYALELGPEAKVFDDAHLRVERNRLGHVADAASRLE